MKQNMRKRSPLAVLLALCLAMQLCVPAAMASNRLMRAGDAAIAQIEEEEGFRAEKYSSGGKWYIGYGTECGAEDYPEGITREEAYVIVQRNAMKVWEDIQNAVEGPTYRERLEADPEAKLTKETLDEIFDPWDFLTRKDEVFKRLESLEF